MSVRITVDHLPLADPQSLAPILEIVRNTIEIDFSKYRVATVQRRVRNRMITVGARTLDEYFGLVRTSPDEVERLAERLTIKVSRFYRNRAVFDALRHEVLPELLSDRRSGPLSIWVAGCGCGEEAYTLGMLLAERGAAGTIEATDIDRFALEAAACGVYGPAALEELPADLAHRFLRAVPQRGGTAYRVVDEIRARVRLRRHDVTTGAPDPARDAGYALVSCRNVLIYLQKEAQDRALRALMNRLSSRGVLVLGEAEWPSAAAAKRLEILSQKARIFRAIDSSTGDHR